MIIIYTKDLHQKKSKHKPLPYKKIQLKKDWNYLNKDDNTTINILLYSYKPTDEESKILKYLTNHNELPQQLVEMVVMFEYNNYYRLEFYPDSINKNYQIGAFENLSID